MRNVIWTENEQMKVVWNIVDSEMMFKTQPRTKERKAIINRIISKLLVDPDFSERLKSDNPEGTIYQHIQAWVGYLEKRRENRPPLIKGRK